MSDQQDQEQILKKVKLDQDQNEINIPQDQQIPAPNEKSEEIQEEKVEQEQQQQKLTVKDYEEKNKQQRKEFEQLQADLAPRRCFLHNVQRFDIEKDVLSFVNRFTPVKDEEFKIAKIWKDKGKFFAIIEFESAEERERFATCFNDPENFSKTKKISIKNKSSEELSKARKGKPIDKIKGFMKKISTAPVATKEQIEEQRKVKIIDRVCPLLEVDYKEQLKQKKDSFQKVLEDWTHKSKKLLKDTNQQFWPQWVKDFLPVPITQIVECDESERLRYRNKMEFTFGKDLDGNIKVGMNKGNMANGTISVDSADECLVLTEEGLLVANELQAYILQKSEENRESYVFDRYAAKGLYKCVVIRQSKKTKQIMITLVLYVKDVSSEIVEQEKNNLKSLFIDNPSQKFKDHYLQNGYEIVALNVQCTQNASEGDSQDEVECLHGKPFYIEEILGKKFKVSHSAFLQNHTGMTDKLYSVIRDLVKDDMDQNTIFLDVCSGLGTIGMCMAESCKEVIGIEMVKDACDSAIQNCELNQIKNYKVICSKVEDFMLQIITEQKERNPNAKIIAVVDPPRAGLHKAVVKSLRNCSQIDQLVYVACRPSSVIENLNYLCLPSGVEKRGGVPFIPTKSFVVDLFPMTSHYEGIFFLTRNQEQNNSNQQ